MPRDRRYHHGGHGPDLSGLITGIGEAISPTEANPYYNAKPGDVPFDKNVDPEKFLKGQHTDQPFRGFLGARANLEAAQDQLELEQKNKAALAAAAAKRAQEMGWRGQEVTAATNAINNEILGAQPPYAAGAGVGLSPLPSSPPLALVPSMSPEAATGLLGDAILRHSGISSYPDVRRAFVSDAATLPYVGPTAAANAERGAMLAGAGRDVVRDNPATIRAASLAPFVAPVLANKAAMQENRKRKAQKYADAFVPIHGVTATGPGSYITLTPETHAGYQPNDKGAYEFIQGKPSMPMAMTTLPNGKIVTIGGPSPSAAPPPPPASTPGPGPGFSTPSLSLKPNAFNPNPIQDTGLLPSLINRNKAASARSDVEAQTAQETEAADRFPYLRDFIDFYWHGPQTRTQDPTIFHPALPMPPKRRLTPAYGPGY